jgi:hypothetical protein
MVFKTDWPRLLRIMRRRWASWSSLGNVRDLLINWFSLGSVI